MSAGHEDHNAPAGVSARTIDKYMRDPSLVRLAHRMRRLDRTYDLPYLAGYSKDGETIYIDRHLPTTITQEYDGKKYSFDPDYYLQIHESWEKALIDHYGFSYSPAHQAATKIEHRAVLASGIPTHVYDGRGSEISKYIKADEHEKLKRVPKDLDLTPYQDNKRLLAHLKKKMGQKSNDD